MVREFGGVVVQALFIERRHLVGFEKTHNAPVLEERQEGLDPIVNCARLGILGLVRVPLCEDIFPINLAEVDFTSDRSEAI